ncbi:MAG: Uma2 family endonuclease [Bacteroidota bacterium]
MSKQLDRRLVSVDDYYLMAKVGILDPKEKIELIRGEIINMSPIGSKHALCVNALALIFISKLSRKIGVSIQNSVRLNSYSEPKPDLAILKAPIYAYGENHPGPKDVYLLIEVADTSLGKDKSLKQKLYAEAGIPEYWVVDIEAECVEVFQDVEKGTYNKSTQFKREDELRFEPLNISFSVRELFVES